MNGAVEATVIVFALLATGAAVLMVIQMKHWLCEERARTREHVERLEAIVRRCPACNGGHPPRRCEVCGGSGIIGGTASNGQTPDRRLVK